MFKIGVIHKCMTPILMIYLHNFKSNFEINLNSILTQFSVQYWVWFQFKFWPHWKESLVNFEDLRAFGPWRPIFPVKNWFSWIFPSPGNPPYQSLFQRYKIEGRGGERGSFFSEFVWSTLFQMLIIFLDSNQTKVRTMWRGGKVDLDKIEELFYIFFPSTTTNWWVNLSA